MITTLKTCYVCEEQKYLIEFSKRKGYKYGVTPRCKKCIAKANVINKNNSKNKEKQEIKNEIGEVWADVLEYENIYKVSNLGRVCSVKKYSHASHKKCQPKNYLLKQQSNKQGYLTVALYKDGKYKMKRVHVLVAIAFIPNPNNYPIVNHEDGITFHNSVVNLKWSTFSLNALHSIYVLGNPTQIGKKTVIQLDMDGNEIKRYDTIKETCSFGFTRRSVQNCCHGRRKSHKGYKFKFLEAEKE